MHAQAIKTKAVSMQVVDAGAEAEVVAIAEAEAELEVGAEAEAEVEAEEEAETAACTAEIEAPALNRTSEAEWLDRCLAQAHAACSFAHAHTRTCRHTHGTDSPSRQDGGEHPGLQ